MAKRIRKPLFTLIYNDQDITSDISKMNHSISYDDYYSGQSDCFECTLENRDLRWLSSWYPEKGDRVKLDIRFEGIHLPCGTFEVDEISADGPPDKITLRGIATGFNSSIREEHTRSWENVTLSDIVEDIAVSAGMATYIELDEVLQFTRMEQNQQTDLAFLAELAKTYDVSFKETGNAIYFISLSLLYDRPLTYIMRRYYCSRYSFRDKTADLYKGVAIEYVDPETGEKVEYKEDWPCPANGGCILRVKKQFDSEADAKKQAAALKRNHNGKEQTGSFTSAGNAKLLAGMILAVEGWGMYDGNWFITHTRHSISRSGGYTTDINIQRAIES